LSDFFDLQTRSPGKRGRATKKGWKKKNYKGLKEKKVRALGVPRCCLAIAWTGARKKKERLGEEKRNWTEKEKYVGQWRKEGKKNANARKRLCPWELTDAFTFIQVGRVKYAALGEGRKEKKKKKGGSLRQAPADPI